MFWNIIFYYKYRHIGVSPSGKAPVFGTGIRGFESLHPSQIDYA